MKWYLWVILIFLLSGCKHKCPSCPEIIYKEKVVVRIVEKPVYIIVSDNKRLQVAYQIAKEALVAMSSSTTTYHPILCEDGKRRYWTVYAHWKLKQVQQALSKGE